MNQQNNTDKNYDKVWKIRYLFDKLNEVFAKVHLSI
jgi:hypothetical protein